MAERASVCFSTNSINFQDHHKMKERTDRSDLHSLLLAQKTQVFGSSKRVPMETPSPIPQDSLLVLISLIGAKPVMPISANQSRILWLMVSRATDRPWKINGVVLALS